MIGAAAGIFVGIQTGASIPVFTNATFLLLMTLAGATGFYLGIDVPPHRFQGIPVDLPGRGLDGRIDASELLAAVGTLLAATSVVEGLACCPRRTSFDGLVRRYDRGDGATLA